MFKVDNLTIEFNDLKAEERVVDGISFEVKPGEILGLVGESGSGKTLTALAVAGLLPDHALLKRGSIFLDGTDLLHLSEKEKRSVQGKVIGMIFQDPMTSLNPVMKIGRQVEENLRLHTDMPAALRREKALQALADVELDQPERIYGQYPHQLSGGMRQRVMIASVIICRPRIIIADEPTTALDVTVQKQIISLMKKINQKYGTSILFISHDLGVVKELCEQVLVMHQGRIVETGSVLEVFSEPREDYTKQLIDAIPSRRKRYRKERSDG